MSFFYIIRFGCQKVRSHFLFVILHNSVLIKQNYIHSQHAYFLVLLRHLLITTLANSPASRLKQCSVVIIMLAESEKIRLSFACKYNFALLLNRIVQNDNAN